LGNTESKSECASSLSEIFKLFPRLQERLAQNAAHLSGGEQQMLAIGRALMLKPKVLLLDEPTEGLAPLIVNELLSAIQGLKSLGLTMILVEQNISKMLKISDEIVILNNGEVSLNGTPQSIAESNTDLNTLLGIF
jgi:branched-chain amino acid transport system ATP-binding protein